MTLPLLLAIVLCLPACSLLMAAPRSPADVGGKANGERGTASVDAVPTDVSCTGAPDVTQQPWNHRVKGAAIAVETPHHRFRIPTAR
jgi:hypothetical protein